MNQTRSILLSLFAPVLAATALLGSVGCSRQESAPAPPPADTNTVGSQTSKVQYTCPMHPEVVKDGPARCEKCGMNLVVKK